MRPIGLLLVVGCILLAPTARALTAQHRLDHAVVPTSQTLRLDIDARRKDFSGSTRISLRATTASDSFQLYAEGLKIASLVLRDARGRVPATWAVGDHGVMTVHASRVMRPGAYSLDIAWSALFDTRADALYRLETGGESYAFTQFEAIAARRAFPCWDEPEFKIPWQLTLTVPRAHRAISNTPILRDSVTGATRRVSFERTPPMPSYLVAIATGPLETVPILGMGVPGNVVCVKGQKRLAEYTARNTAAIVSRLERYFGRRYPYRKLDLLAVPEFEAGAMENAGAIMFRETVLLFDPATMSASDRRNFLTTTAHEISHMWFGDLVTMKWWDDVWLNESFASWLGDKVSDQVAPEFHLPVVELEGTHGAMNVDARPSTHAMRQSADAFDNLDDLFDFLAYQKGQAVLGMLERWLGPDVFRAGVRRYLSAHEWGNAEGADLWNALSKVSGQAASDVAVSFLDQPGVPLVVMDVEGGQVRLRQSRFHNFGAPAESGRWKIPVTLEWSSGGTIARRTVVLTDSVQTVPVPEGATWIHPNADEAGYYRWSVAPDRLTQLADSAAAVLNARERVGFVHNLSALLDAGLLHGDDFLRLLARFGNDPEPLVVTAVTDGLAHAHGAFLTTSNAAAFAAYVRRTLGPAYQRIGPSRVPGEDTNVTILRGTLMAWLGDEGRDPNVLQRGRALAEAYLQDPATVDPSLAQVSLSLAALRGDTTLFEAYRRNFERTTVPTERRRLLAGIAGFRAPAMLARALDYVLHGPLRPQEILDYYRSANVNPDVRDQLLEWTMQHFDEIAPRVPPYAVNTLATPAGGCSLERLEKGRAFFLDPARHIPGIDKQFAKVSDQTHDCVGLHDREGAAVASYLTGLARAE